MEKPARITEKTRPAHAFCVAPMLKCTDRHCRYFYRLMSRHARLYTEMITARAIIHGDRDALLRYSPHEHPVALQLGGSNRRELVQAAKAGEDYGYDEINLNAGCPSARVRSGAFGACLMKEPLLVADCVAAMAAATNIPVTVKCRTGVDDQNPDEALRDFVRACKSAGVRIFIIHARKAWLAGLSPKENRTVPPLDHGLVKTLKQENPELSVILNGGIGNIREGLEHLDAVDGIMMGRAVYDNPFLLAQVDRAFYGKPHTPQDRAEIAGHMSDYIKKMYEKGVRPHAVIRHMAGLYRGMQGAKQWRRLLARASAATGPEVLDEACRLFELHTAKDPSCMNKPFQTPPEQPDRFVSPA